MPVRSRVWAVLLGLIGLLSLGGYVALLLVSDLRRSAAAVGNYIIVFSVLFPLYLVACFIVLRHGKALPLRSTLVTIGVVAVISRGIMVFAAPTLSNDMYRYIWDGRVQAAGISPYAYTPGAAEVKWLHPQGYWIWEHINRKWAYTLYPPGAQLYFAGVYQIVPDSVQGMKAAMSALDVGSCVALAVLLASLGMAPSRSLIYAWSPLPIIELAGNGHLAALEVLLTLLTLIAAVHAVRHLPPTTTGNRRFRLWPRTTLPTAPPTRHDLPEIQTPKGHPKSKIQNRNKAWALAVVGMASAMLAMLIPALLLAGWVRRFGVKFALLCVGIFLAVSAGYIAWYEGHLSSFMAVYLRDESFNAPLYFFLAQFPAPPFGLTDGAVRLGLFALLGVIALLVMVKRERGAYDFIGKSFLLVAAYLFTTTNAHAWYFTWLLMFVPLLLPPHGLPLFGAEGEDVPERVRLWRGDYGPALAALLYTGVTFLGYTVFAFRVPRVPAPIAALEMAVVVGIGLVWPLAGWLYWRARIRRPATTDIPPVQQPG